MPLRSCASITRNQGMIWFRFIFLARSWAQDSKHYIKQLASLAQQVKRENTPFTFFLYPEGTLVSSETRPLSRKWASKCGISDMQHILLPRTTGLHYALRTLAPRMPDLHLLDVTVAYEGKRLHVRTSTSVNAFTRYPSRCLWTIVLYSALSLSGRRPTTKNPPPPQNVSCNVSNSHRRRGYFCGEGTPSEQKGRRNLHCRIYSL
jgi:hypothetical protein